MISVWHNGLETSKHLKSLVIFVCSKNFCGMTIYIVPTNRLSSFKYTSAGTADLIDCHRLILSRLKPHFKRLPPSQFIYKVNFSSEKFLHDLNHEIIKG